MTAPAFDVSATKRGLPPGPTASSIVQGLRFARRPTEMLEECARAYGPSFTCRLFGGVPMAMFSDPEANRQIFTAGQDEASAAEANRLLGPILGRNSLLLLDGSRHTRERRLVLPPFHGERMQRYAEIIDELANREIDRWPIDKPFSLRPGMPGRSVQTARTIRSISAPACEAR